MERHMAKNKLSLCALLLCFISGLGASAYSQSSSSAGQQPEAAPRIVIGPGDVLDVEVFDTPELSQPSARVSQTGQVTLPVLGTVNVAGLNAIQAARRIESQLQGRGIMLTPHVTISVVEYASQGATVLGEVKAPGVYPTFGDRRLLDIIAMAGGLAPTAGKIVTIAHRSDPHHQEVIRLAQKSLGLAQQENPVIKPGDTIMVGHAGIIYILGAVKRSGGFLVDNNEPLSLLQVISLAGGWDQSAALSKARLIRKVPGGHEEMTLDLKHVIGGKQADVSVEDGDILFLPSSLGKTLGYKGLDAAIAAAQTAVVYDSGNF